MNIQSVINLEDMRELARRKLPRIAFDFIDGAVDDELCLKRNRNAFVELTRFDGHLIVMKEGVRNA